MQLKLEVALPVAPTKSVVGDNWVGPQKDVETLKVFVQPIQNNNVGGDHKKVASQLALRLVRLMKKAPCQGKAKNFGLAAPGGHFDDVSRPILVKHSGRDGAARVESHEIKFVFDLHHVVQIDDRLNRFTLCKVVPKL